MNAFHKYNYATEAAIVAAVRKEMAARSLLLVPNVKSVEWTAIQTSAGKPERLCTLMVTFTVHDGENGTTLGFDVLGQGQDSGDKASYKAMTGATKYALLKLFLIPTGHDPEDEPAQKAPPPAGAAAVRAMATKPQPQSAPVGPPEPPPIGEEYAPAEDSQASAPVSHDRALAFKFGKDKGKPLSALDDNSVSWYRQYLQRDIADPAKAQWARMATLQLATVDAELRFRGLPI